MSGVVVGGNVIPIAAQGTKRIRMDGVDRSRRFDNSYSASLTGGPVRDWMFQTPPVLRSLADGYEAVLGVVTPQTCFGDIIALPTMCCAEITGWTPVVTAQGHSVVIDFTLHEVQPARALLRYSPGDTIAGETFTRSTSASYIGATGLLGSQAINVKRDGHYISAIRSLLMEGPGVNNLTFPSDFSNAAWVKTTMTVATGVADPTGGTGACTLTATGTNALAQQTLANSTNIVRTGTGWLRRRTGTGTIQLINPNNSGFTPVVLTAAWQRFTIVGSSAIGRGAGVQIATNGDAVDVFGFDNEDTPFATSTMLVTPRGSDFYSLPFTPTPGELSIYLKWVDEGTIPTNNAVVGAIASAAGANPYLLLQSIGTNAIRAFHHNGVTQVSSDATLAAVAGDVCELRVVLFGDGSILASGSRNGAAEVLGTQSAANALAAAWSGQLSWLGAPSGGGLVQMFGSVQAFKIIAGIRSLAELRAL